MGTDGTWPFLLLLSMSFKEVLEEQAWRDPHGTALPVAVITDCLPPANASRVRCLGTTIWQCSWESIRTMPCVWARGPQALVTLLESSLESRDLGGGKRGPMAGRVKVLLCAWGQGTATSEALS